MSGERIGVVGAGVAGLTATHLLRRGHDVLLFEAQPRLGGHAHTHSLPSTVSGTVAVDSGFIVHNERTYPNLLRLFRELGVRTRDSEMSMSVRCLGCGLEYAGGRKLSGLLPTWGQLRRGRYLRMLAEVSRFHREARRLLDADGRDELSLGEFLAEGGYSEFFVDHFMLPVVSAVWSAGERISREYPARYLFEFLRNHGMLSVGGSPTWRTVAGGSRSYVDAVVKHEAPGNLAVHQNTPVRAVTRHADWVEIRDDADETHRVDRVVLATHADEALALLTDPTETERAVLGAFEYSRNETWLHTDASLLPTARGARASWNYLKTGCGGDPERVAVSYHMNRLMGLAQPEDYVVTLNATGRVDPSSVLAKMVYTHPVYTRESVAAQRRLPELNADRVAYAGAYHGWGFHEDGCAAGVRAANWFGVDW
jgi:predicted NAD/FAD-binding protein